MIVRSLDSVTTVDWGNGLSRRFLLEADGLGYSVTDTTVRAGTKSLLEYRRHLEACYCIEGSGEVVALDGTTHRITPGTLYALDQHDAHYLIADPDTDLRLVCVFSPALRGNERHSLDAAHCSAY
ncbi:ectoine synthase [Streptomyces qinzhouensis]|uniref:L-ectoine synthase n=1 Tax=Streptomyces qinzhouensis TaxID=2599401 RepID=A0A5B8JGH4_9ACTN|nr:ectoine synthase [Streptomyces qinzhouensis]QDY75222.1 ectoine synthase [Streptomyces qinzhouensis]QDY80576.1 ectoine synthase [Streptomyces qinzhouensis]